MNNQNKTVTPPPKEVSRYKAASIIGQLVGLAPELMAYSYGQKIGREDRDTANELSLRERQISGSNAAQLNAALQSRSTKKTAAEDPMKTLLDTLTVAEKKKKLDEPDYWEKKLFDVNIADKSRKAAEDSAIRLKDRDQETRQASDIQKQQDAMRKEKEQLDAYIKAAKELQAMPERERKNVDIDSLYYKHLYEIRYGKADAEDAFSQYNW